MFGAFLGALKNVSYSILETRISQTATMSNRLCRLNCSLILGKDSQNLCPVIVQVLSYIMLPHVHTLVNTTNSRGYLGSTIGGEYVAKPPLSLRLYNFKTQGFS